MNTKYEELRRRHRIRKIRNGFWKVEWEDGSFSHHSTEKGALRAVTLSGNNNGEMTTATQQFIKDAIAGGWPNRHYDDAQHETFRIQHYQDCWIDPTFWQAVGKTRGWVASPSGKLVEMLYHWHRFIDHLADGKTIEEALAAIQMNYEKVDH